MPRKKLSLFYVKMVITYWLVISVVIFIMLPVYQKSLSSDKQNIVSQLNNEIQLHYSSLCRQLHFLPSVAESVYRNSCIQSLAQMKESDEQIAAKLFETYIDKQHYLWATPVNAACCMVQFKENQSIITNQSVYASKEFFYDNFYSLPNMDFEEWQHDLWIAKTRIEEVDGLNLNNEQMNAILYHYYYPTLRNPSMIITFVIDTITLQQELLIGKLKDHGLVNIEFTNGSNCVALSFGSIEKIDGLEVFSQSMNGSSINVVIDESIFNESRKESLRFLFSYIMPAVLSATLLSLGCAFFYTKPLAKVMKLLNIRHVNTNPHQSMYNDICASFNEIINDSNTYAQEKVIFSEELSRLIIRLSIEKSDINGENLLRLTETIPALKGAYSVLAVEFRTIGNVQNVNFLSRLIPMLTNSFIIDNDSITYILIPTIPNGSQDNIIYCIKAALDINNEDEPIAFFGLSPCCNDVLMLPKSFEYAREALLQAYLKSDNKIAVYSTNSNRENRNEILDVDRFTWIVENGNNEMLEALFNKLLFDLNQSPSQVLEAKMVYYTMLRILRKEATVYLLTISFSEYNSDMTLLRNMNMIKELAQQIQSRITDKRIELQNNVANNVLVYIQEHAFSEELSLTHIAEHFDFSERYVYKLIQEQTGMSYIEYVLLLRINEAKRRLVISDSTIKDIALAVGYTNIGSFNKMFKNKVGDTPQEYRKKHRKDG